MHCTAETSSAETMKIAVAVLAGMIVMVCARLPQGLIQLCSESTAVLVYYFAEEAQAQAHALAQMALEDSFGVAVHVVSG